LFRFIYINRQPRLHTPKTGDALGFQAELTDFFERTSNQVQRVQRTLNPPGRWLPMLPSPAVHTALQKTPRQS
jgi:hypothetical protein